MQVIGPPTQADYLIFLRNVVRVPVYAMADDSPAVAISYGLALDIVSTQLHGMGDNVYTHALYNLAADRLITFAPDLPGQTFFQELRTTFGSLKFVAGVIAASSDEGTSATVMTPEALKSLTLMDLQNLKTPYGREYLAMAQQIGTLWGIT